MTPYINDLDFKRGVQRKVSTAEGGKLLEGLASGVSSSLLTPGPQCGSHTRYTGKMSVYMLWAVLVFRKSDE